MLKPDYPLIRLPGASLIKFMLDNNLIRDTIDYTGNIKKKLDNDTGTGTNRRPKSMMSSME